ncbi:MFS transporter [Bordetella genomosp. 8]|uniref:MFS transporter n=1 Tax=Bordetella genomosp. 8 TaxID=1416806 RepID=UPI0018E05659|nr:MFS transporter [Bordetella genomosp. 8]
MAQGNKGVAGMDGGGAYTGSIEDRQVIGKAARRLIPLIMILYVCAYLDRVNISFAALQMNADLGLSNAVYGFGASMFFVSYFLFEVPSNLVLDKVGPRRWIARIMISWGIVSGCMAFVQGETSFYALRFLLGVAEAGFFPGIVMYISYWFPKSYRARFTSIFMMSIPVSGLIGSPISGSILDGMNGVGGLAGWQWMFIVEALPAVVLGIACLWLLTDRPSKATWLAPAERDRLESMLAHERASLEAVRKYKLSEAFTSPGVLLLAGILFCIVFGTTGIAFFLPQIIKSFGFSNTAVGFLSVLPYLGGVCAMYLWARHSDLKREKIRHLGVALVLAAVGFVFTTLMLGNHAAALFGLVVAAAGVYAANTMLWTLPTSLLTGTAAAAAVALINSLANLSGILAPPLLGWSRDVTGGYAATGIIFAAFVVLGALLTWAFWHSELAAGERHPNTKESHGIAAHRRSA